MDILPKKQSTSTGTQILDGLPIHPEMEIISYSSRSHSTPMASWVIKANWYRCEGCCLKNLHG
jgi:hypothetical protein